MNPLRVALVTSLRSQLSPGRFVGLALASLALLLFVLLPVPGAEGSLFASRVEILRACLLFPGILVALDLRKAWPALGPEDTAQVWLHLSGAPAWMPRLGALLGGLLALLTLFVFQALLLGLGLSVLPDSPKFHRASVLLAEKGQPGASFLVQPGDAEDFSLPLGTGQVGTGQVRALLLRPRWSVGPTGPIEVEVFAARLTGSWRSLGRTSFESSGDSRRLPLAEGLGNASRIQVRRLSPAGTMISLAFGEVLLLGTGLGPIQTALRATLPYLPWAFLLLLAALSLTALLSPGLWGLAVLCLLPTIGMAPGLATDQTGSHLGQGFSSLPALPGMSWVLLALTLLVIGLLCPRKIRPKEVPA